MIECPTCNGSGFIGQGACPSCGGKGSVIPYGLFIMLLIALILFTAGQVYQSQIVAPYTISTISKINR